MRTFDKPAWMLVAQLEWGIRKAGLQFAGPFNGTMQAVDFVAERWTVSVTLTPKLRSESGAVEAFFNNMAGGINRVRLAHLASGTMGNPYAPRGTLRGSPTLFSPIARGNTLFVLGNCAPGSTVLAGDMLGCNGQLFQASDDAVANGAGQMVVQSVTRVRAAAAAGMPVVWDAPKAEFLMPAMGASHQHATAILMPGQFDLEEVW